MWFMPFKLIPWTALDSFTEEYVLQATAPMPLGRRVRTVARRPLTDRPN
jgi:hypothetical protein